MPSSSDRSKDGGMGARFGKAPAHAEALNRRAATEARQPKNEKAQHDGWAYDKAENARACL